MKHISDIVTQMDEAPRSAKSLPAVEQAHRVSLSYMVFAEVQVQAIDARQARAKALAAAKWARRKFAGGPCDYRVEVIDYIDPKTGEPVWVEIDKPSR